MRPLARSVVALMLASLAACGGRSELAPYVTKFVDAAGGNFNGIRGPLKEALRYDKVYASTVVMPGADFCSVAVFSSLTTAGCGYSTKNEGDARAKFDALVEAVRQAEPGWQYTTPPAPKGAMEAWRAADDRRSVNVVLYQEDADNFSIDFGVLNNRIDN